MSTPIRDGTSLPLAPRGKSPRTLGTPWLGARRLAALSLGLAAVAACGAAPRHRSAPAVPADVGVPWAPPGVAWAIEARTAESLSTAAAACRLYLGTSACAEFSRAVTIAGAAQPNALGLALLDADSAARAIWLATSPDAHAARLPAKASRTASGAAVLVSTGEQIHVLRAADVVVVESAVKSVRERWAVWFAAQPSAPPAASQAPTMAPSVRFRIDGEQVRAWAATTSLALVADALGHASGELRLSTTDGQLTLHLETTDDARASFAEAAPNALPDTAERMPTLLLNARLSPAPLGRVLAATADEPVRDDLAPLLRDASGTFGVAAFDDGRLDARVGANSEAAAATLARFFGAAVPFITWSHVGNLVAGSTGSAFAATLPVDAAATTPRRYAELVKRTAAPAAVLALLYRQGLAPGVAGSPPRETLPALASDNLDVPRSQAFDAAATAYAEARTALEATDAAYDAWLVTTLSLNGGAHAALDGVAALRISAASPPATGITIAIDYLGENQPLGLALDTLLAERSRLLAEQAALADARQRQFSAARTALADALRIRASDVVAWDREHGP